MIFKVIMYTRRVASQKARLGNHINIFMKMQRTTKKIKIIMYTQRVASQKARGAHIIIS